MAKNKTRNAFGESYFETGHRHQKPFGTDEPGPKQETRQKKRTARVLARRRTTDTRAEELNQSHDRREHHELRQAPQRRV